MSSIYKQLAMTDGVCRIAVHDDNLTQTALDSLLLVSGMKIASLSSLSGQLNDLSPFDCFQ